MANYQVFPGPGASKAANKRMNKSSTVKTNAAKLGIDITGKYGAITKENAQIRAEGKTTVIKVNSNPVPGKTVIGPLAKGVGSGGVAGLALGAVAAYKAELKAAAEAKKIKNRMN
jgi:hypothetical protein